MASRMEICHSSDYCIRRDLLSSDYQIVLTHHETRIDIESPENITVTEEITVINNISTPMSNIIIDLDQPALILRIEDSMDELNFDFVSFNEIFINFRYSIGLLQSYSFRIIYQLDIELDFTAGKPSYYIFPFTCHIQYFTEKHFVTIRLPSYSNLHETESGPPPYLPENATENPTGNRLYLEWELENLEPNTEIPFIVFFDESYSPPIAPWKIAVILVIGIIAGAIGVYWIMQMRDKRTKKAIGRVYLTEDQNLILKLVSQNEGRMSQKELLELTNFTKSKISRNLTTLEKQGLITKEKWGREFRVYLTKEGRKVVE